MDWLGMAPDALETGGSALQTNRALIKAGMLRLLQTMPGEYGPDANRGNQAYRYLHMPMTGGVPAIIAYSCLECIAGYEDRVSVNLDVELSVGVMNEDGGIAVNVPFTWSDDWTEDYLAVTFPLVKEVVDDEFAY